MTLQNINYHNALERQMLQEKKMQLKSDGINEMDNFYQKRNAETLKKYSDNLDNVRLIEEQNRRQTQRENDYRSKLNNMNEKIYDHAMNFNGYIQNSKSDSPKFSEPFHIKNDYEFNRKVAENKAIEKENFKKDPMPINRRLRDLESQREMEYKEKREKLENQKSYKDYLDHQKSSFQGYQDSQQNVPNLIMPSYHYLNKPVPLSRKAVDSIDWVKHNHLETLNNRNRFCYLGSSNLRHNPITQPLNDFEYNKYLSKQRKNYNNNGATNNMMSSVDSINTLVKVGSSIIS